MIIEPPSKSPPDATMPFPVTHEASSIHESGDGTQRNFYLRSDGTYHDGESAHEFSLPPAVICRLGENDRDIFIECYDRTGRIVKLR